jgi:hypothetical protein
MTTIQPNAARSSGPTYRRRSLIHERRNASPATASGTAAPTTTRGQRLWPDGAVPIIVPTRTHPSLRRPERGRASAVRQMAIGYRLSKSSQRTAIGFGRTRLTGPLVGASIRRPDRDCRGETAATADVQYKTSPGWYAIRQRILGPRLPQPVPRSTVMAEIRRMDRFYDLRASMGTSSESGLRRATGPGSSDWLCRARAGGPVETTRHRTADNAHVIVMGGRSHWLSEAIEAAASSRIRAPGR